MGKIAINPAYSGTFHWGTVRRLPDGRLTDGAEFVTLPGAIPAIVTGDAVDSRESRIHHV